MFGPAQSHIAKCQDLITSDRAVMQTQNPKLPLRENYFCKLVHALDVEEVMIKNQNPHWSRKRYILVLYSVMIVDDFCVGIILLYNYLLNCFWTDLEEVWAECANAFVVDEIIC